MYIPLYPGMRAGGGDAGEPAADNGGGQNAYTGVCKIYSVRQSEEIRREIRMAERELAVIKKRSAEPDVIFKRLYKDSVLGGITPEQFQTP